MEGKIKTKMKQNSSYKQFPATLISIVVLFIMVFSISFTSAWSTNIFNNSLTSENLTFTTNENITRWLSVPENTFITNGYMNLSGYYNNITSYPILSASAVVGSSCSFCSDTPPGSSKACVDMHNYENQDWEQYSYCRGDGDVGWVWINYSLNFTGISNFGEIVIDTLIASAVASNRLEHWNYTLRVFNYTSGNYVIFYNDAGQADRGRSLDYFNVSDYINNTNLSLNLYMEGKQYTDGQIRNTMLKFYGITYIPSGQSGFSRTSGNISNPYVQINDTQVWNHTGEFNSTFSPKQTSNLMEAISNYISTATAVAGYYLIPFIFHSDTAGLLEYFDLVFNNDGLQEINQTLNSQTYQTQEENFEITLGYDSSEWSNIAGILHWGSSEYTGTKVGSGDTIQFTRTINIPADALGVKDVYWTFALTNTTGTYNFDSTHNNQTVNETIFTLCNATYSTVFLNVSFKDEANLEIINASIPTSTFDYWLGDGTVRKTYTYINNTDNFNYEFCATPNLTLNTDIYIQYKQNSDYPQRTHDQDDISLSNTTTNLMLYLLDVADGLYNTFTIVNIADQPIQGVAASITRIINGEPIVVGVGETGASGKVTFWLNPDFLHVFNFYKSPFPIYTFEDFANQQAWDMITLGTTTVENIDFTKGVTKSFSPSGDWVTKNNIYDFSFIVSSTTYNLDEWGYILNYSNGTTIDTKSSTENTGGTLTSSNINISTSKHIIMDAYFTVNGTRFNVNRIWKTQGAGSEYSIWNFFQRFTNYTEANILGIKGEDGDDDFGIALISFLILVLVSGGLTYRYGIQSEAAIMGIIFGLVAFLDIGLNWIPTPVNAMPHFITVVIGFILVGFLIKEELR